MESRADDNEEILPGDDVNLGLDHSTRELEKLVVFPALPCYVTF